MKKPKKKTIRPTRKVMTKKTTAQKIVRSKLRPKAKVKPAARVQRPATFFKQAREAAQAQGQAQVSSAPRQPKEVKEKKAPVIVRSFNPQSPRRSYSEYAAKIKVVGVGGGGGNAISRMREHMAVRSLDFIAINTDAQDLDYCNARYRLYIGKNATRGLGAGMSPELGRQAADENKAEIGEILRGADLVFVTAGLGGGTGSGASPEVARIAREQGALTIGVVTKPFGFEGAQRSKIAQEALEKLKEQVDAIIVIPNDRIFSIIPKDTPFLKAFEYVDDVLRSAVEGIADLVALPGIINVDFADVKTIMHQAGTALIGIGQASGQDRAQKAVAKAVNSPLLEVAIEGAKGVLFSISGGRDLKMSEINEVAKAITDSVDASAKIIFGAYHDKRVKQGQLKVTLIATAFSGEGFKRSESLSGLFNTPIMQKKTTEEPVDTAPAVMPASSSSLFDLVRGTTKPVDTTPIDEKKETSPKREKEIEPDDGGSQWDIPAFLRRKKK